jgi:hypothetical protein
LASLVGSDTEGVTGSNPVAPTRHNVSIDPPLSAACQQITPCDRGNTLSADRFGWLQAIRQAALMVEPRSPTTPRVEPRSPTAPRVEGSGRTGWHARPPAASAPPTNPAPEPTEGRQLDPWPTSLAQSLAPGGLVACHGVHRPAVPRAGQTARPGTRKGQEMRQFEQDWLELGSRVARSLHYQHRRNLRHVEAAEAEAAAEH